MDTALGQRLLNPTAVFVQFNDTPAGIGMTPSGLWVEHSKGLPAIFGEILAVGAEAYAQGYRIGMFVLFARYAGEITDELDDGRNFAIFGMEDVLAEIPKGALVYSDEEMARFNLKPDYSGVT
jgi:co-chaperonin GroES (HSP10)